ncbi:uncharacterized protein BO97DRAFT_456365 [Aspergillus homomorphus CBS 101889]|uniref:FAD-binding domain-containing protein n=1 Tax=Aspergillus homomorphus (strain CBS 101889) TaxID=1450537 RepID=A0A395IBW8_ASPHC|nr:hypothetical protein BO97DRAFT_456365 [Aspergillus homomorphus CBS 101889]RAL16643.1 hypothetical protein BO97DRAFT_456365 [Aspergillus homomorphus CBS 101889]
MLRVPRISRISRPTRFACSIQMGDVVVGADGVRSTVRRQMWEYTDSRGLRKQASEERAKMTSEYSYVFGISAATPGLIPGTRHRTFGQKWSFLTIIGKEDRAYWFFFKKLGMKYSASQFPRFDQTTIGQYVGPYLHKPINGSVSFAEVYKRAITRTLLPLEEASYTHWTIDRWVCIGDSAHKMTSNLGRGDNSAIEISTRELGDCLQSWQKKRHPRMQGISQAAHNLTRLEALDTLKERIFARYLLPYSEESLAKTTSDIIVRAAKIDYLPPPLKSTTYRALWALPLLGLFAVSKISLGSLLAKLTPQLVATVDRGTWVTGNGEVFDLTTPLYHSRLLDRLMRPLITCFLPSITGTDMRSRLQMLSFMTDLGPIYGIWLLESYRNVHSWSEILLPLAAGSILQLLGIWQVAPLYLAQEYLRTPLFTLLAGKNGRIPCDFTGSLLLATLVGYHTVTYANFFDPALQSRQWYNVLWQLFPLTTSLLQAALLLSKRVLNRPCSYPEDQLPRRKSQHSERRYLRWAYGTFALVSGLAFMYTRITALPDLPFHRIFLPGWHNSENSLSGAVAWFLRYGELISMRGGFVWLALRFHELQQAGAPVSLGRVGAPFAASLCAFGPGATFTLGWGWRDELLD